MIRRTVTTLAILTLVAIPLLCLVDRWTPLSVGWGSPRSLPCTLMRLDSLTLHIDRLTSAGQVPWISDSERDYGVLRWRAMRSPGIWGKMSADGGFENRHWLFDPRAFLSSDGVGIVETDDYLPNACHTQIGIAAWPIWGVAAVYLIAIRFAGPCRRYRRRKKGHCLKCGYNLTGNVSGVCPECGENI